MKQSNASERKNRPRQGATPGASGSQGDRLREARLAAGYATASDAARHMEVAGPTYLAHENGTRTIRPDIGAFYAKAFNVSPSWLLFGESNDPPDTSPAPGVGSDPILQSYASLLQSLDVIYSNGVLRPRDPTNRVLTLPQLDGVPHFVPELVLPMNTRSERLVSVRISQPGSQHQPLAVRSIVPLGASLGAPGRYFAVRPHLRDPFLEDAARTQLVVCDADGLNLLDASPTVVLALINQSIRTVIAWREDDDLLRFRLSKRGDVQLADPDNLTPLLGIPLLQVSDIATSEIAAPAIALTRRGAA